MGVFSFEHSRAAHRADLALYGTLAVLLAVAALATISPGRAIAGGAWVLAGLACWSLVEYLLHRFVLHGLQPFRHWHDQHHQRPTALIGLPTVGSGMVFALLVFLPAGLLLPAGSACALSLGMVVGYLGYSAVHDAVHHAPQAGRWLRERQRWHAVHHGASGRALHFGVTSAFWDRVFGSAGTARRGADRQAIGAARDPSPPPAGQAASDQHAAGRH